MLKRGVLPPVSPPPLPPVYTTENILETDIISTLEWRLHIVYNIEVRPNMFDSSKREEYKENGPYGEKVVLVWGCLPFSRVNIYKPCLSVYLSFFTLPIWNVIA